PTSRGYHTMSVIKGRLRRATQRMRSKKSFTSPVDVFAPHGAFVVFHKSYFEAGGTLRYGSFLFGEEIFVGETALRLGRRVVFDPRLEVIHAGGISVRIRDYGSMIDTMRQSYAYLANEYFTRPR